MLKYTKEHTWAEIKGEFATIGITDFAQKQLKDIVFVELPQTGRHVTQFKPFAVIESIKSVSDVIAPLSGEIIEVNDELRDKPDLLNKDYKTWIIKMRIEDKNEIKKLFNKE